MLRRKSFALSHALVLPIHRSFFLHKLQWFPVTALRSLVYLAAFGCGKIYLDGSVRHVHSDLQFKRGKITKDSSRRNNKKNKKSNVKKRDVEQKPVYMRDTILKIYTILKYSTWDSAQVELRAIPTKWDSHTVNRVLKSHPPMEKAWLFFNWVGRMEGFKHDQYTYTTMLDIFGEARRFSSMMFIFKQMQEKGIRIDAVTCTSLMHWLSESGDVDGAVKAWKLIRCPTVVSYTAYIKILFRYNRVKEASNAFEKMIQSGISPNRHTYTVLMEHLIGFGKSKEAMEIFGKMQEAKVWPDKAACNILMQKLSESGDTWAMSEILHYIKENRVILRYHIFIKALEALNNAGETNAVALLRNVYPHHSTELFRKDSDNMCLCFTLDEELVLNLLKKADLRTVDNLLSGIADKNIKLDSAIVSAIIDTNCGRCRLDAALWAFDYSLKTGITISQHSYLALLGNLIRLNMFKKVVQVFEEMTKARHCIGIYLASILIHKIGCAKKPKLACQVFDLLPSDHKCSSTYTALIGAHFSAGSFDQGLDVFRRMQKKGVVPSLGTYNLILNALSRSGKVTELGVLSNEKRRFMLGHRGPQHKSSFEEKICNLLFAEDVVYPHPSPRTNIRPRDNNKRKINKGIQKA